LSTIHHPKSRISNAVDLHLVEEGQVNVEIATAMEFVDGALIYLAKHPSWILGLSNTKSQL
jgi:hypothetical protein